MLRLGEEKRTDILKELIRRETGAQRKERPVRRIRTFNAFIFINSGTCKICPSAKAHTYIT